MNILCTIPNGILRGQLFNESTIKILKDMNIIWNNTEYEMNKEELLKFIEDIDILITGWGSIKIDNDILTKAKKLKLICHTAGSIKFLVDKDFFDKDILIINAKSELSKGIAEYCLMMSLVYSNELLEIINEMNNGKWRSNIEISDGLNGKSVGIIGYRAISKEFIRLLRPFNVDIYVYSNYCTEEEARTNNFRLSSLNDVMQKDIVSLHNTLNSKTKNMIGKKELELIKDGALFINTARAGIVNENDLINELRKERFKAVLDVFYEEPLPMDSKLRSFDNVILTPHSAGTNKYYRQRQGDIIVEDICRYIENKKPKNIIDKNMYMRMTIR